MGRSGHIFIKWMARLSLLGFMLIPALYCAAWRMGIIKYACGQRTSPSMQATYDVMYNPCTEVAMHFLLLTAGLLSAYMFAELRYGANALLEIKKAIQQMMRKWYLSIPVLAFVIWYLFLRVPKYYWPQSWLMFSILLSATVLLWGANFSAAPRAEKK